MQLTLDSQVRPDVGGNGVGGDGLGGEGVGRDGMGRAGVGRDGVGAGGKLSAVPSMKREKYSMSSSSWP